MITRDIQAQATVSFVFFYLNFLWQFYYYYWNEPQNGIPDLKPEKKMKRVKIFCFVRIFVVDHPLEVTVLVAVNEWVEHFFFSFSVCKFADSWYYKRQPQSLLQHVKNSWKTFADVLCFFHRIKSKRKKTEENNRIKEEPTKEANYRRKREAVRWGKDRERENGREKNLSEFFFFSEAKWNHLERLKTLSTFGPPKWILASFAFFCFLFFRMCTMCRTFLRVCSFIILFRYFLTGNDTEEKKTKNKSNWSRKRGLCRFTVYQMSECAKNVNNFLGSIPSRICFHNIHTMQKLRKQIELLQLNGMGERQEKQKRKIKKRMNEREKTAKGREKKKGSEKISKEITVME